jgi:hypothetical protein
VGGALVFGVVVVPAALAASCSTLPDRNERGCVLETTDPGAGSANLPIAEAAVTATFNVRVTANPPPDALTLVGERSGAVAGVTEPGTETSALRFVADEPLRFGERYVLDASGVRDAEGRACSGEAELSARRPVVVPADPVPAPPFDLVQSGSFLYAASQGVQALQVFRIDEPDRPELRATLALPGTPERLAIAGAQLFAVTPEVGVVFVDVASETDPAVVQTLGEVLDGCDRDDGCTFEELVDVAVIETPDRRFLALADASEGVWIVRVDEDRPSLEAFVEVRTSPDDPADLRGLDFAEVGARRLLGIANGRRGASVIDLTTLDAPTLVGETGPPPEGTPGLVRDVALDGDVLVAARGAVGLDTYAVDDLAGGAIDDVAIPSPSHVFRRVAVFGGRVEVAGGRGGEVSYAIASGVLSDELLRPVDGFSNVALAVSERVYVGAGPGIVVFEPGQGDPPTGRTEGGLGDVVALDILDNRLYAVGDGSGLHTFDLASPTRPDLVSTTPIPSLRESTRGPASVVATPSYLALGDGRVRSEEDGVFRPQLLVFDPTVDPPVLLGTAEGQDEVGSVRALGDIAFACAGNAGLSVFDLADLSAPSLFDILDLDRVRCTATEVVGNTAFAGTDRVNRFDVSSLVEIVRQPPLVFPGGDTVNDIAVVDGELYLATERRDAIDDSTAFLLRAFDVDGSTLSEFSTPDPLLGGARAIEIRGPFVFVAARAAGVYVFDRRDLQTLGAEAEPVAILPSPGEVLDLAVGPATVYAAQRGAGVLAIDTGPLPP